MSSNVATHAVGVDYAVRGFGPGEETPRHSLPASSSEGCERPATKLQYNKLGDVYAADLEIHHSVDTYFADDVILRI